MSDVLKLDWSLNLKLQVGIWQSRREKMNKKGGAAKHTYASMMYKMSYLLDFCQEKNSSNEH